MCRSTVVVAAVAGVAACGGGTPPIAAPTPARRAPPGLVVSQTVKPQCDGRDLAIAHADNPELGAAGAGEREDRVAIVNDGHAACMVRGTPTIRYLDRDGKPLPIPTGPADEDGDAPDTILLRPHTAATFSVQFSSCPSTPRTPPAAIRVRLPGILTAVEAQAVGELQPTVCDDTGSERVVSPLTVDR